MIKEIGNFNDFIDENRARLQDLFFLVDDRITFLADPRGFLLKHFDILSNIKSKVTSNNKIEMVKFHDQSNFNAYRSLLIDLIIVFSFYWYLKHDENTINILCKEESEQKYILDKMYLLEKSFKASENKSNLIVSIGVKKETLKKIDLLLFTFEPKAKYFNRKDFKGNVIFISPEYII